MERYIHLDSGMALTAPDGTSLPQGAYYACGSVDVEPMQRARLAKAAEKLGIDVPAKASKAAIAKLIDRRACDIFAADEAENAGRPTGVAPAGEDDADEDDASEEGVGDE